MEYDGFGINGNDVYKTRLLTFAKHVDEFERARIGRLIAAAPKLLAQLKSANIAIEILTKAYMDCGNGKLKHAEGKLIQDTFDANKAAIAKAEGN